MQEGSCLRYHMLYELDRHGQYGLIDSPRQAQTLLWTLVVCMYLRCP